MSVLAAASVHAGITVLKSTPDEVVFQWELGEYRLIKAGAEVTLSAPGTNTQTVAPDGAVLPSFAFLIGLPPDGAAVVSLRATQTTTEHLSAPLQTRGPPPSTPGARRQAWVSGPERAELMRLDAERRVLCPFVYEPRTRALRVLRSARVTVAIGGNTSYVGPPTGNGAFEQVLRRTLLNYNAARRWRRPQASDGTVSKARATNPVPPDGMVLHFEVGDGHAGYNEGTTHENGLVALAGSLVTQLFSTQVAFERVRLYASASGELPLEVPGHAAGVPSGLVEIPLLPVDHDGDGRLDEEDSLVTWVSGAHDWEFNSAQGTYAYRTNRFDDYRHYWLVEGAGGGSSMPTAVLPAAGVSPPRTRFTDRLHLERSRLMPKGRHATLDWRWFRLTGVDPEASFQDLPLGPVSTDTSGRLRIVRSSASGGQGFSMSFACQQLCDNCSPGVWYDVSAWDDPTLTVAFGGGGVATNYMDVDYVDIEYPRELRLGGEGRLTVFSPTAPGLVTYRLSGLPPDDLVFIVRIPQDEHRLSLVDTVRAGAGGTYSWTDTAGVGLRYHVAVRAGFQPPPQLEEYRSTNASAYGITDLRTGDACDYLLVYPEAFADEADRLAAHKQESGRFANPRVVELGDIYREFSGGQADPTALRNFVWHAHHTWPNGDRLFYVVLMGLGHWDLRGIQSGEPCRIPVHIVESGEFPAEEQFYVDSLDATVGRLPCQTVTEAAAIVDKILDMEQVGRADFGAWRNRVLLVADNDRQGVDPDGTNHYASSELTGDVILARRPAADLLKTYLFEYTYDASWNMPAASQALVAELNAGAGVVNYYGHGSDNVWADERVLAVDDLPKLRNEKRYPFVVSLSCEVGLFDRPGHDCLADLLVRASASGAAATLSATRMSSAPTNTGFGLSLHNALFDDSLPVSIGQACQVARLQSSSSLRRYAMLGDPSLVLVNPARTIALTVTDADGTEIDTAQALQRITVRGTVSRPGSTSPDNSFGTVETPAFVQVGLYNPSDSTTRKDGMSTVYSSEVAYTLPGSPLFVGRTAVRAGVFEQELLTGRAVVFDRTGTRLTAYAWQDTLMGLGCDTTLVFHGTDTTSSGTDSVGPTIALRLAESTDDGPAPCFSDVIHSALPVSCEIVVSDPNGIDVVGTGPDEGLTIEIPGVLSRRSINDAFQFLEGDYRTGSAPLVLAEGEVQPGQYRLIVTARDLLENLSVLKASLDIVKPAELKLSQVFNHPNPMRMREGTRFYYTLPNSPYLPDHGIVLKIYTMSGTLLRSVHQPANGWFWDGRDQLGTLLPPNVYLYRFTAWSNAGTSDMQESPVMKVVVHPPR